MLHVLSVLGAGEVLGLIALTVWPLAVVMAVKLVAAKLSWWWWWWLWWFLWVALAGRNWRAATHERRKLSCQCKKV